MSRIVRSSHFGTVPIPPMYQQLQQQPRIYCPVCHIDYAQSETDTHIMKHTVRNVVFASRKTEQVSVSTQPSRTAFTYPMIEALQFSTEDCSRSRISQDTMRFSRLEKNKREPKQIQRANQEVQISNQKPLLQYKSEETDLYNCFDSVFNGKGFQKQDIMDRNVGLASKRHLNEWEVDRVNKK